MKEANHIDSSGIFAVLLFLLISFFIVRGFVKKKVTSFRTFDNLSADFNTQLIKELEFAYHIKERGNTIIINHNDFENSIISGELILVTKNKNNKTTIEITYKRSIKFSGLILTFLSLLLCYVGVLIPIITVQNTKKKTIEKIDSIFQIIKSINN